MPSYSQKGYTARQHRTNAKLDELRSELSQASEYLASFTSDAPRVVQGFKNNVEWLQPDERWPIVDTVDTMGQAKGATVLYCNVQDYASLSRKDMARYRFIVIPKFHNRALLGQQLEQLKLTIGTQNPKHAYVNVQEYVGETAGVTSRTTEEAVERIEEMLEREETGVSRPLVGRVGELGDRLGWNFLDMFGLLLQPVTSPTAVHTNLEILYRLLDVLRQNNINGISKDTETTLELQRLYNDVFSCIRFLILGERGSFSGNHMDILGGTWVMSVTGRKLWWVYTGPWNEKIKREFIKDGPSWNPGAGNMQLIYLEPGDVLLMMPGHPCVHAPFTKEDSLMTGGMFWNEDTLPQLLDMMTWINTHNDSVSNEAVPRQLVSVLELLRTTRPTDSKVIKALDNAKEKLIPILSCQCTGKCGKHCKCRRGGNEGSWRNEGCTAWCSCTCTKEGIQTAKKRKAPTLDDEDKNDDYEPGRKKKKAGVAKPPAVKPTAALPEPFDSAHTPPTPIKNKANIAKKKSTVTTVEETVIARELRELSISPTVPAASSLPPAAHPAQHKSKPMKSAVSKPAKAAESRSVKAAAPVTDNYDTLTSNALRAENSRRRLPWASKKADIIKQLREDDRNKMDED